MDQFFQYKTSLVSDLNVNDEKNDFKCLCCNFSVHFRLFVYGFTEPIFLFQIVLFITEIVYIFTCGKGRTVVVMTQKIK